MIEHPRRHLLLWRGVLTVLIAVSLNTGAGLLVAGSRSIATPTYEVIRAWPGGVRGLGVLALLLAAATCWAWGRGPTALARVLPLGAVYHALWALCIAAAYVTTGIFAWPALGSWTALTVLWVLLALTIPSRPRQRATDRKAGHEEA